MATLYRDQRGGWRVRYRDPVDRRHRYRRFPDEQSGREFLAVVVEAPALGGGGVATPLADRILNSRVVDQRGCWVWQRTINNEGYGAIGIHPGGGVQVTRLAHRVSYETFRGPIPEGLVLDHLCRNRACVNPAHLEPVTHRENVLRSPIAPAAINAAKTHCPHGHPYDDENTYRRPGRPNERYCRACMRDYARNYNRRRRAEAKAQSATTIRETSQGEQP